MHARLAFLASFCAAALTLTFATAKPITIRDSPISIPFARRVNVTGVPSILKQDQARARALKSGSRGRGKGVGSGFKQASLFDADATNQAVDYVASVGVGAPPTFYNLIVDTGSSNTWVGAGQEYVHTASSVDTGDEVAVSYGSGLVFGEEFIDTVTIGDLVIQRQSIGVAGIAFGFEGVDGILGIGPTDLTEGTTSSGGSIPTVLDNAFAQDLIPSELIGVSFEPTTSLEITNGVLTFGGVNPGKFIGDIAFVPITSTSPATDYVGIDQVITYGAAGTPILDSTAGITDTGTTLILIASDAFTKYQAATGAVEDNDTGLLKLTPGQFANLDSLFFHIGGNTYELTPNAQIWPRSLNTAIGGDNDSVYLITADLGSESGEGLDFIDGMTFLERFYYVFDSTNSQVGFAPTEFTNATTN